MNYLSNMSPILVLCFLNVKSEIGFNRLTVNGLEKYKL